MLKLPVGHAHFPMYAFHHAQNKIGRLATPRRAALMLNLSLNHIGHVRVIITVHVQFMDPFHSLIHNITVV